jgi:hypothetical protein
MGCECGLVLSTGHRSPRKPNRSPAQRHLDPAARPLFELKALASFTCLIESFALAIDSFTSATSSVTPVIDLFPCSNEVTLFQSSSPFTHVIDSLALVSESMTLVSQLTCSHSLAAVSKVASLPTRIESITTPQNQGEGGRPSSILRAPDDNARKEARAEFVSDLREAAAFLRNQHRAA